MNLLSGTTLVMGLFLLFYGYLSRLLGIYFFWESATIGWLTLLLSGFFFLVHRIKSRQQQNNKSLLEKVGIGFICLFAFIHVLIWAMMGYSEARTASLAALQRDSKLQEQIGQLQEISVKPIGSITIQSSGAGEQGTADLHLIAKGSRKFQDIRLFVSKELTDSTWNVRTIEYQ